MKDELGKFTMYSWSDADVCPKQILTVDNYIISFGQAVLNSSESTFTESDFDSSDLGGEVGADYIDKITVWPRIHGARRKDKRLPVGMDKEADIYKIGRAKDRVVGFEKPPLA
jgi:hypothetical protein